MNPLPSAKKKARRTAAAKPDTPRLTFKDLHPLIKEACLEMTDGDLDRVEVISWGEALVR